MHSLQTRYFFWSTASIGAPKSEHCPTSKFLSYKRAYSTTFVIAKKREHTGFASAGDELLPLQPSG